MGCQASTPEPAPAAGSGPVLKRRPHGTYKNARNPRRTPRSYGRAGHRSPGECLRHPRGCLAYPNCAQNVGRSHGDFPGRYRQRVCIAQRQYTIWLFTVSCPQGGWISTMRYPNSLGTPFSVILRVSHYRRSRNMFAAGQLHLCSDMIHSKFYIKSTSEIVGGNRPDGDIFDPRDPKVSRTRFGGAVIASECSRRRAHCWVESETKRSLTCKICSIVGGVGTLWRSRPLRRLVR